MVITKTNDVSLLGAAGSAERKQMEVRRAAVEFESLLLTYFTAALHPEKEEEEDSLFSSSADSMYRQMFSEEVARTLAKSGDIGLADAVLRQLGAGAERKSLASKAIEIARLVRDGREDLAPEFKARAMELDRKAASMFARPLRGGRPAENNYENNKEEIDLQLPVDGQITSTFGSRRDPFQGTLRRHNGVDIAAPSGTPIQAAAAGTVIFAGRRGGYGNLVEIDHPDGRRTRYAHAAEILVARGQEVAEGQTIATVGSTGRSTGPHLHFEVTENGTRVNPMDILAKDFHDSSR
jgi:murein DD-endopeptidase MepM/ murein hydrolase activator NlpD